MSEQETYKKEDFTPSKFKTPNGTVAFLDGMNVKESKFSIKNPDGTTSYYLQRYDKFKCVTQYTN